MQDALRVCPIRAYAQKGNISILGNWIYPPLTLKNYSNVVSGLFIWKRRLRWCHDVSWKFKFSDTYENVLDSPKFKCKIIENDVPGAKLLQKEWRNMRCPSWRSVRSAEIKVWKERSRISCTGTSFIGYVYILTVSDNNSYSIIAIYNNYNHYK